MEAIVYLRGSSKAPLVGRVKDTDLENISRGEGGILSMILKDTGLIYYIPVYSIEFIQRIDYKVKDESSRY